MQSLFSLTQVLVYPITNRFGIRDNDSTDQSPLSPENARRIPLTFDPISPGKNTDQHPGISVVVYGLNVHKQDVQLKGH